ncbi:hypothetical protein [Nocardiopsis xinjiangensis]|uniref:hypothetical protein n=1 Tax=Nocardiopsis xinjiangensis TaxID=124285 RepID=UPI0003483347|nr:hypothetical protein [Nocardiopsis xinjiangensis]
MDTPTGRTPPVPPRRTSRLPRAVFLCLLASVLLGALTEWPVWVCVAVAVPASVLLSGLATGYLRSGGDRATDPGG